ncbi:MAG: Flp family type IVb pilin [Planctomycetota bacterium]
MIQSAWRFLSSEDGVIVSAEIVLITTVIEIGCIAGLATLGHAVNTELVHCAESCQSMSGYYLQPPVNPYPGQTTPTYPASPTYPAPPAPYDQGDLLGSGTLP